MLLFFQAVFCHEYLIKLLGRNLFLQGQETIQGLPKAGPRTDANLFIFKNVDKEINKKLIYVKDLPNQVLDIPLKNSTKLIFYPMHGFSNQQFEVVPTDMVRGYRLVQNGQCIGWIPDEKDFRKEACTAENLNQIFEMICADCPGRKSKALSAPPGVINSEEEHKDTFLDDNTKDLIKEIGKLCVEINNCFISNGTCKSLDNSHIKLHCYSPFDSPDLTELWPDLKYGIRHEDDYSDETLAILGDSDGYYHNQNHLKDVEQEHIDEKHPEYFRNHPDPHDHYHQNEEIYHDGYGNLQLPPSNPEGPVLPSNANKKSGLNNTTKLLDLSKAETDEQSPPKNNSSNEKKIDDPIIITSIPEKAPTAKEIIEFLSPRLGALKELGIY